ncbi:MAG TPA: AMP-binding protein [Vicinamibacteria bacterium]|nr:AMP-binding protein [Vicinamibacteria bacterium]
MAHPWLGHYPAGVPHSLHPYPDTTLLAILEQTARERPHHPAIHFKGKTLTAGAWDRAANAFAAGLRDLGVERNERVALLLPNCPQFLIAEFGAWKAGATVVPLNPIYNEEELRGPLQQTGAETIVVLTPFYERVKSIQAETSLRRVIATNIKEHFPPLLSFLFTVFKEKSLGHRVRLRAEDLWLADLLGAHEGAAAPNDPARGEEIALILMSGGTTGTPKGVMAPHRGLVATGLQGHAWLSPALEDEKDTAMLPLPLFHAAAGVVALASFMVGRNPLILVPSPRDLDDVLDTIQKTRPSFFAGVPTLFNALLGHPRVQAGKVDFRSIKLCFCGAAALLAETRRRFEALTGGRIIEAYSLTEALVALVGNPVQGPTKEGSVGLPLPDVEVRIADVETGEGPLPPNDVGEVLIRAPQIMPGYWENPEASGQALRRHGEGGPWLHTGDLGRLDEDGCLFIVDRLKDLIKPGGLQVWPREVEEVIATMPAVAEVGVAGVLDPARGEAVKAWVVCRPGSTLTEDAVRAYCKQRLAPYKVPTQVEFRKELPKSLVGKVLRRALRAEAVPASA